MGVLQLMLSGRLNGSRLNARVKWDLSDNLILKCNAQVSHKSSPYLTVHVYLKQFAIVEQ